MGNIIHLPPTGNPYLANPDIEQLCRSLDLARAEHAALLEFRLRRRDFARTRSLDDEARMVAARDKWSRAYQAAQEGASS